MLSGLLCLNKSISKSPSKESRRRQRQILQTPFLELRDAVELRGLVLVYSTLESSPRRRSSQ
ncbi:hypothetical protein ETH_00027410, partial [Eimeria tenella]